MKDPKPYVKKVGKNWKAILIGKNDKGKGRRSLMILGQARTGFDSQREAGEFIRNKWHRRQDMVAFASKSGNGTVVLGKDKVSEVRFAPDHPLHLGATGGQPKRLKKNAKAKTKAKANKVEAAAEFAVPEQIDVRKNALEFIISSAGINGRMVSEQEASRILDAVGGQMVIHHGLTEQDFLGTLSAEYLSDHAQMLAHDPANMSPEAIQSQLRFLSHKQEQLQNHVQ